MGNLLPGLVGLPFCAAGVFVMWHQSKILGFGLVWFILGVIAAAVSLNWLGLYQNRTMQAEFDMRFGGKLSHLDGDKVFVGAARPHYHSSVDPHEDIGYLFITSTSLEFIGERFQVRFLKSDLKRFSFRSNPHTWLGIGGWICIEGDVAGKPAAILVEPRAHPTLFQNKVERKNLMKTLSEWQTKP